MNATPVVQNPVLSNIASESNRGFMDSTPPPKNDSVNFEMLGIYTSYSYDILMIL